MKKNPVVKTRILLNRVGAMLLALLLLVGGIPTQVLAEDRDEQPAPAEEMTEGEGTSEDTEGLVIEEVVESSETIIPKEGILPDEDALLEDYINHIAFETPEPQTNLFMRKSSRRDRLKVAEKNAYDALKEKIETLASGSDEDNYAQIQLTYGEVFPPDVMSARYTAADLGVDSIVETCPKCKGSGKVGGVECTKCKGQKKVISDATKQALSTKYKFKSSEVLNALLYDCPYAFYWFDKVYGMPFGNGATIATEWLDNELTAYYSDGIMLFIFAVSENYAYSNWEQFETFDYGSEEQPDLRPIQTDPSKTGAASAIVTEANSVVSNASGLSDLEKLESYRDYICGEVSYNSNAANNSSTPYGDPWQLIHVFDKNNATNVVCEGYSKAFKFLCDLTEFDNDTIDCYLATGTMGGGTGEGPHMWNTVAIDGKNYLVDVTNCDEGSAGHPDLLFMRGTETREYPVEAFDQYEGDYDTERYTFTNPNIWYYYDYDTMSSFDDSERLLATTDYSVEEPPSIEPGTVLPTDQTSPRDDNIFVLVTGSFSTLGKEEILRRINLIRYTACREGDWKYNIYTGQPGDERYSLSIDYGANPTDVQLSQENGDYVPVKWSEELERIAEIRAVEGIIKYGHTRPNSYNEGADCMLINGYGFNAHENGSWYPSMASAISGWLAERNAWLNKSGTSGHYMQLIKPDNTYIGLASFTYDEDAKGGKPKKSYPMATFFEGASTPQSGSTYPTQIFFSAGYTLGIGYLRNNTGYTMTETARGLRGDYSQIVEVANSDVTSIEIDAESSMEPNTEVPAGLLATLSMVDSKYGTRVSQTSTWPVYDECVTWSSDNPSVVSVVDGKIKALGVGSATVTASSAGKSASLTIAVDHEWDDGVVITEPTCTTEGLRRHTCVNDGSTKEVSIPINIDSHEWEEATYTWTTDNETVTATRVCSRDASHNETETVSATSAVTTQPTCTEKGKTTYTSSAFTNEAFEVQVKTLENIDALNHNWGEATYAWADDNSSVTASRNCSREGCQQSETETISATSEVTTQPTCTEKGKTTYTSGAFANEVFVVQEKTLENINALNHLWSETTYAWADDNSSVTASRNCTRAGCQQAETETVSATSAVTTQPTCTEKGKTTYTSAAFTNEAFEVQVRTLENINATDHKYGSWTKLNDDQHQKVCEHDPTHVISEAHTWDEGVVTTEPTFTNDGVKTYTCSVCSGTKEEVIPKKTPTLIDSMDIGNVWTDLSPIQGIAFTTAFDPDGELESLMEFEDQWWQNVEKADEQIHINENKLPEPDHTYQFYVKIKPKDGYCFDDAKFAEFIYGGSEVASGDYTKTLNTDGSITLTWGVKATASRVDINNVSIVVDGIVDKKCTGSAVTQSPTITFKAAENEHYNLTSGVDYTLSYENNETPGTATVIIAGIGKYKGTRNVTFVITHDLTKVAAEASTCAKIGNEEHWKCKGCNKLFSDSDGTNEINESDVLIAKKRHTEAPIPAVAATCSKTGLTEGTKCSVCNTVLKPQTTIPKTNHNWNSATYTWSPDNKTVTATRVCKNDASHKETETVSTTSTESPKATCTKKGKTKYTGAFKNAAFKTQTKVVENIPATGHKYGPWTNLNATQHQRVCANDESHVEKQYHTWDKGKVTKAATCGAAGVKTYTCTACKATKTETIKATGKHTWNAGKVTKQPTTTATGVKTFTCTVCKATKTETIAKLPIKDPALRRIYGDNRYKTSLAIAETYIKETKQTKLNNIIVASGTTFPDALAGSYLAKSRNAPIIIWHEQLNKDVQTFIKQKVKPGGTVYILGGPIAVGESIKKNMGGYKFVRLAENNRYGTNLRILDNVGLNKAEVLVCDGGNDGKGINALIASATGKPLLLVDKNGLIPIQKTWLGKNKGKIAKFVIVGDGKSVPAKVEKELKAYGTVTRISGRNGDEVSANVASTYYKNAKEIFIATMDDYPDGLCGGPLAIYLKGPILLVNAKTNAASVKYAKSLTDLTRANVLGGDKALPEATARKIAKNTKAKLIEYKKQ